MRAVRPALKEMTLVSTIKIGSGLCVALLLGVTACGGDDEGGSGGRPSCAQLCERIEAPECPNAAPNCVAACEDDIGETPSACNDELDALSACFGRATFSCDEDGVPQADACQDELDGWLRCRADNPKNDADGDDADGNGDGGNAGDGSGDGDEQNVCAPEPGDETCDSCAKDSCCAELSDCGPACQEIVSCVQFCSDDPCIEACITDNVTGAQAAAALFTCIGTSCATSCGSDEPEPSEDLCLPGDVPEGYCDGTGLPVGHDCPGGAPFESCVLSPTGAANVYCCDQ
jgi:hypothetical protein